MRTPENLTGRIIFISMFNDISCGSKDNEQECESNARLVSQNAKRFGTGQWSFIGPGLEKKWYSISEDSPQGEWDRTAEKMLVELAESGCPIFRATSPLSQGRLKSKGHGKLSIHYAADLETIETIFRIKFPANQLSLYGAVAEICEESESLHEKTERPFVMESSYSLVLSVIKTEMLFDCDDLANKDLLLQQYGERIGKLSQQDKLSKICTDAGFLNVVDIGQYFVTKDTAKLVNTNSKQLMPKKNAEFQEKNYGDSNWNFVKFINEVLQRWRNYENSKVLHSIRSQDGTSSRTRALFWNYQVEYKNYKMK